MRLAIGDGVSMAEVQYFAEKALVGHAWGRNLITRFLNRWLELNWSGKVQSLPKVTKLMIRWFLFMQASKDEAESVLAKTWQMAGVPIVL